MTKAIVRSGPMSTPAMNMKSPAGWPYIWTTIGLANAVTKLSTRHTCPMMMIPHQHGHLRADGVEALDRLRLLAHADEHDDQVVADPDDRGGEEVQHGVEDGVRVARRAQPCVVVGDEGQRIQTERGEQLAPAHEHDDERPGQVERERVLAQRPRAEVAEQVDERKRLNERRNERWNEEAA